MSEGMIVGAIILVLGMILGSVATYLIIAPYADGDDGGGADDEPWYPPSDWVKLLREDDVR